ncbi:MAG TPA: CHAT domain-containing protein, partial [Chloroflexia bacterium]
MADSTTERPDAPAAVPPDPYAPFYIWISGTADAPQVAVDHAPGGDLAQSALDVRYLPAVQRLVGLVHGGATDPGTVANLGRGLYTILFTPALRDLYQRSLGRLAAGGRLRLLLRVDPPALAALPWELLYDPTDNIFLALDPVVSVARYLPQAARPAPAPRSGPLRVLAVFASPTTLPALDLTRELALIVTALQTLPPGQVALDVLMDAPTAAVAQLGIVPKGPPTPAAVTDAIGAGYDVLHYGGHGALQDGGGLLALENADRSAAFFDAASLGIAVKGTRLRLAVLTAC